MKVGESDSLFPNYFTYVSAFVELSLLAVVGLSVILLLCSDYTVDGSTYLQLFSMFASSLLFYSAVLLQFLHAWSEAISYRDYLLMATGVLVFMTAVFFFIAFGVAKNRVRSAVMCRDDPVLKRKVANSNDTSNATSLRQRLHRIPTRLEDELNINYVDSYLGNPSMANLGNPAVASPLSLAMLGKVDHAHGRRVKSRKNSLAESTQLVEEDSSV